MAQHLEGLFIMKEIIDVFYTRKQDRTKKASEVACDAPTSVLSYQELVQRVTVLANKNRGYYLLYRGQDMEYKGNAAAEPAKLLPSFFRSPNQGGKLGKVVREERTKALESATKELVDMKFGDSFYSADNLRRYNELAWALLQHYEIVPTPLLDLTGSLQVACSIATLSWEKRKTETKEAVVYVLGFDEITPNISFSYNSGIQLIRLASVLPEIASRPLYQDGYLAGNFPPSDVFDKQNSPDFSARLIAKFSFYPEDFWKKPFEKLGQDVLFPMNDKMAHQLQKLKKKFAKSTVRHASSAGH
jgi:hypothetical protein